VTTVSPQHPANPSYERILVATDGSDDATAAVAQAAGLAAAYDATLYIVHVVDTELFDPAVAAQAVFRSLERYGESAVQAAAERATAAGVETVRTSIERGDPHRAILDYADAHDVDLVVLGRRGWSGLERSLVGSVAERVCRLADVPVLTVRATAD